MGELQSQRRSRRQTLNRYFLKSGKWYVESREGLQGPFFRREEAAAHLDRHIRRHGRPRNDTSLEFDLQEDLGL
jgi:hypothetical protein